MSVPPPYHRFPWSAYPARVRVRPFEVTGHARHPLAEVQRVRRQLVGGVEVCDHCGLVVVRLDPWETTDGTHEGWWAVGFDLDSLALQRSVPSCVPLHRDETAVF